MTYITKFSQNVVTDTNNSSTAPLNAGLTFTGTSTATTGVAAVQINLKTDQNCTVYVDQSTDGTNRDISDSYSYIVSIDNFGVTVQATALYYRVRVTNTTTVNQTYLRLQSNLCPIVEALPRSLNSNGHLKTAIYKIEDGYGFEIENTPMGEMRTIEPVRLVGTQFDGTTIDTNFWTATTASSATITQANSQIVLTSGTNSAGSAILNSVRKGTYRTGGVLRFRANIQLGDTGTASNAKVRGVAFGATMPTITDGAYFQMLGTDFRVVTLKSNTPTVVSTGSFNGTLGATYTPGTTITTFEIYWTNSKVYFVINDQILHTVSATTATWCGTMNHYIYMHNINAGSTTSTTLSCRNASIYRLGKLESERTSKFINSAATTVCKYSPGRLYGVVMGEATQTVTLYDNTAGSGTIIGQLINTIPGGGGHNIPSTVEFNCPFFNGLTVITSTSAPITLLYE